MKKQDTTNTFGEGLIMDLNPLVTPNNVVTNCLNGTLITYNGNENVLQNDMGNGRVETAYLPEGYVPLGTAELGGIIYIVSYNPLIDKCQIGCFPSPERNITSDELQTPQISVKNEQFQQTDTGKILNTILKVKLLSDPNSEDGIFKLNPGDKYTVYSTNKGVTNNVDYISDVGQEEHIVDIDPRTVTIHIVSIGEDGKIVYLDDSLKWTDESGNPAHYYIKECKQGDDVKKDIDEYRSLVSSAYNIFNSKVSGELALLFELKIIDTFSATWDAEVEDIEGVTKEQAESGTLNKEATIHFNINYTSDHKKINLKHVLLTDSKFPGKDMETEPEVKDIHCTLDIKEGSRENDGTDPDIQTTIAKFKYNSEGNLSDYIWNYALTPAMKFGYLDFLTLKGSINFLEIGSGKTELDEWRYFIQDNNFYLNWGLSAYPEKNKKIDRVIMTFIPFDQVNKSNIESFEADFNKKEEEQTEQKKYTQYVITGKNSYSGYFQELLPFDTVNSKIKNVKLKRNFLYLVDVCVDYGKEGEFEHRHKYKWLYTTKQWNDVFVHDVTRLDFSTLTLDDVLKFGPVFDIDDSISQQTNINVPKVNFPRIYDENTQEATIDGKKYSQPYAVANAQITSVNYKQGTTPSFDTSQKSVTAEVETECTSFPELFKFEKQTEDNYSFKLGETSISHDNFVPKSDTRDSSLASQTISKVVKQDALKQVKVPSDLITTIQTILDEGIKSSDLNDKAEDSFTATLTSRDKGFDINVIGAIFSRINADLAIKPVSIGQEIRPFLYTESDYVSIGLESSTAFTEKFTEEHGDDGGGKPFFFHFYSNTFDHRSSKGNWNPSDDWTRSNWWDDIPPYNVGLNPAMMAASGSFQMMYYKGGKGTKFGETNIQGNRGLWVRTTEGHYVPINAFGSESQLATKVAKLYAQLYYVNTDTIDKELPVVINVNYLTGYSEIWNIEVVSLLSIDNIENNVLLVSKSEDSDSINTYSLATLQANCQDLPIDLSNISMEDIPELDLGKKTISHVFYIQNIELYNQYDDAKSTSIPAIALLSTSETWEKCAAKTANKVYVQKVNSNTVDFTKLDRKTASNIRTSGTLVTKLVDEENRVILSSPSETVGSFNMFYDCFSVSGGTLQFVQNKLLTSKMDMKFQTDSKGDPWSTVHNNSAYGLGF